MTTIHEEGFFTDKAIVILSEALTKSQSKTAEEIETFIHGSLNESNVDLSTAITALSELLSSYLMAADTDTMHRMIVHKSSIVN